MWDTEYNDDSRYAYSVDMGDGDSPLVDSGTKSQEGGSAPFAGWVAQGFANSIAYYGAWYEGEQQNDYYNKKVELTMSDRICLSTNSVIFRSKSGSSAWL